MSVTESCFRAALLFCKPHGACENTRVYSRKHALLAQTCPTHASTPHSRKHALLAQTCPTHASTPHSRKHVPFMQTCATDAIIHILPTIRTEKNGARITCKMCMIMKFESIHILPTIRPRKKRVRITCKMCMNVYREGSTHFRATHPRHTSAPYILATHMTHFVYPPTIDRLYRPFAATAVSTHAINIKLTLNEWHLVRYRCLRGYVGSMSRGGD